MRFWRKWNAWKPLRGFGWTYRLIGSGVPPSSSENKFTILTHYSFRSRVCLRAVALCLLYTTRPAFSAALKKSAGLSDMYGYYCILYHQFQCDSTNTSPTDFEAISRSFDVRYLGES